MTRRLRRTTAGRSRALLAIAAVGVVLLGGTQPWSVRAAVAAEVSAEAMEQAKEIWSSRCVTCHGAQGKGDGPASAGLTPLPRSLNDAAWQKSVDDEHIAKIIKFGGAGVGLSPMMPGNPDLMSKPEVVQGLVKIVRDLGDK